MRISELAERYGAKPTQARYDALIEGIKASDKSIVSVVRCKECKYYQKVYGGVPLREVGHCICHSFETVPEWFCADGERKDDA